MNPSTTTNATDVDSYGLPNVTQQDLDKLSLTVHSFVAEYDLTKIKGRIQVRNDKHVAPAARVQEYAARMKAEPVPPVLITLDDYINDGNTRVAAAGKNKRGFLPAIVLNISWETATDKEKMRLLALAAKANRHGEPLDKREKREIVSDAVKQGWTQDVIGMMVGVTPAVVAQIQDEVKAIEKLERVGLSPNGQIGTTSLRALGKVASLNDEPFKEIVKLATDAGLNGVEIRDLAKRAKDTGSDQAALDVIEKDRAQSAERIAEHKVTGTGKPALARQLRQHLGFLTKNAESADLLLERSELYAGEHLAVLQAANSLLTQLIADQEPLVPQAEPAAA